MSEVTKTVSQIFSEIGGPMRSLQTAREAKSLASITDTTPPDAEKKALDRLNKLLDGDQPIKDNVPRGFYFNIRV